MATPTARLASSTWTTGPVKAGSMRSAVWTFDVVAPPISSGMVMLARCISAATVTISSRLGVMRPESPIMSASFSFAALMMSCQGTITPMSMTSKPLHCSTTPTIFLPMSWTSPLTVAMTILPLPLAPGSFAASMKGRRCATAFFMTRADFTTWGRNILPAPNRSPTTFMPSISGPSITSIGLAAARRASSVSSTTYMSMPLTSACSRRLATGQPRHSCAAFSDAASLPLKDSASVTRRSPASGSVLSSTSSHALRSAGSIES